MKWEARHTFLVILVLVGISAYIIYFKKVELGLDLKGGTHLVYKAKTTKETPNITKDVITRARDIIEKRINGLGVKEPLVQVQGSDKVLVELPGIKDPKRAIKLIGKTAVLQFKDDKNNVIMNGQDLQNAQVGVDQFNRYVVDFVLKKEGAKKFAQFTSQNVGKNLGIYLDKKRISNPRVNEPILGGKGQISGDFTAEEAQDLANLLQGGALPVPLERVEERTIGPTLGKDSINKSITAGIFGILLVVLFMILYYRLPGVISVIALSFYGLFTYALFKTIPVTLTLPGIAGFILSFGMAVDANVLIFERLKEELRTNKTLKAALDAAFNRAWSSILDSNVTTLISAGVLFYFGSSIIKGFALTLSVGVIVSMFTAVTVSKTLLNLICVPSMYEKLWLFGITPQLPYLIRKNVNFVGVRKWFYLLSFAITLPGLYFLFPVKNLTSFPPKTGLVKGLDFTGGSLIEVSFKKAPKLSEVRKVLKKFGMEKSIIQKITSKNIKGKEEIFIRSEFLKSSKRLALEKELTTTFKDAKVERVEDVGPTIGKELTQKAILSVIISSFLITLYLAWRFTRFTFGICAIIALVHDVIVLTGIFAILGKFLGVEIDTLFVSVVLTIIGYSVNDTVVVFDRIRENLKLAKVKESFTSIVNFSLQQTTSRSINTTITTLLPLYTLVFFGGATIYYFALALIIGITSGAYSSIFNASFLLVSIDLFAQGSGVTRVKPLTTSPIQPLSQSSSQQNTTSTATSNILIEETIQKKKKKKKQQRRR